MAVTLAQSALLSQNMLQRGVIQAFVQESVVLDRIPLEEIEGNAYAYDTEATLPGVEFRAVNAGYTEATGTVAQATETLVILGGDADVDRYIQQVRSNLSDQRALQTQLKVRALSYKFQDAFINGDVSVDANSFDGLKKRLSGGNVIAGGTNGIPILGNGGTDAQTFIDVLDAAIAQVELMGQGPPDAIYMNAAQRTKFRGALRRLLIYTEQRDTLGQYVDQYHGIPILNIGTKADGSQILPFSETQGTSSVASSIYVVKWSSGLGIPGIVGLTNGGVQAYDLGELETKPAYRTRVEFYCGIAAMGNSPAVRITGILNS